MEVEAIVKKLKDVRVDGVPLAQCAWVVIAEHALRAARRTLTTREIAAVGLGVGVATNDPRPHNTVYGRLCASEQRDPTGSVIVRVEGRATFGLRAAKGVKRRTFPKYGEGRRKAKAKASKAK